MSDQPIAQLEKSVADLLKLSAKLGRDNELLRTQQRLLQSQIQGLKQKNEIAERRLSQIIARLKSTQD